MRIFYLTLFLLFNITLSAQENSSFHGENNSEVLEVKLYPNPASGGVVNIITASNTTKKITVYDVFGEVVLTDTISRKTLDISRLVSGVYVLQITEGNKTFTRKMVVS